MLGLYSALSLDPIRSNRALNNIITTIPPSLFGQNLIEGFSEPLPLLLGTSLTPGRFEEPTSRSHQPYLEAYCRIRKARLDIFRLPSPQEPCVYEDRDQPVSQSFLRYERRYGTVHSTGDGGDGLAPADGLLKPGRFDCQKARRVESLDGHRQPFATCNFTRRAEFIVYQALVRQEWRRTLGPRSAPDNRPRNLAGQSCVRDR